MGGNIRLGTPPVEGKTFRNREPKVSARRRRKGTGKDYIAPEDNRTRMQIKKSYNLPALLWPPRKGGAVVRGIGPLRDRKDIASNNGLKEPGLPRGDAGF